MKSRFFISLASPLALASFMLSLPVGAKEENAEALDITEEDTGEKDLAPGEGSRNRIGLNLDLGYSTAYVFRGANVFKKDSQMDQHMLIAPGITWSIFDTGFSVGYWGAFQISGDNIGDNIDAALGLEQDLLVSYEMGLPHDLSVAFGLVYYFYPAADEKVTGASVPSYLEPSVDFGYSDVLDAGIKVTYFLGLQDEPGIRGISYLYINPHLGKNFTLNDYVELGAGIGYGFKLFKEGISGKANVHDVTLNFGVPIRPNEVLYITPGINLAWTNDPTEDFANEFVFWGGLNIGVDL